MTTYFSNTKGYTPVTDPNYGDSVKLESHGLNHHVAVFYDDYNNHLRTAHYQNVSKNQVKEILKNGGFKQNDDSMF